MILIMMISRCCMENGIRKKIYKKFPIHRHFLNPMMLTRKLGPKNLTKLHLNQLMQGKMEMWMKAVTSEMILKPSLLQQRKTTLDHQPLSKRLSPPIPKDQIRKHQGMNLTLIVVLRMETYLRLSPCHHLPQSLQVGKPYQVRTIKYLVLRNQLRYCNLSL